MKKYLLSLLLCFTIVPAAYAAADNDALSAADEAIYKTEICEANDVLPEQCTCMITHTLSAMRVEKIHIGLMGMKALNAETPEESNKLLQESNAAAGGEDKAMEIDNQFRTVTDEAGTKCVQ